MPGEILNAIKKTELHSKEWRLILTEKIKINRLNWYRDVLSSIMFAPLKKRKTEGINSTEAEKLCIVRSADDIMFSKAAKEFKQLKEDMKKEREV